MKVLVGIAMLGMLAVVGCGGTVVVTATPTQTVQATATPEPTMTPVPTPTATPEPTATPDLRAALREECDKKIAGALKLFDNVEGDESVSESIRNEPDDPIAAYFVLWILDATSENRMYNRIIEDLEDGEC